VTLAPGLYVLGLYVLGLYVLGLPVLRRRSSILLDGIGVDAVDLTAHLCARLDRGVVAA
jgi:hypothetical protein